MKFIKQSIKCKVVLSMSLDKEIAKLCNEITELNTKHKTFVKMLKCDLKSIVADDNLYKAIIELIDEIDK